MMGTLTKLVLVKAKNNGCKFKDMGGEEFETEYRKVWRTFAPKGTDKELVVRELGKNKFNGKIFAYLYTEGNGAGETGKYECRERRVGSLK